MEQRLQCSSKCMSREMNSVFIATSFSKKGKRLAGLVTDLFAEFGIQCFLGEYFGGNKISESVAARIASASFVCVVLIRMHKAGDGSWEPSQWVIQEMTRANDLSKPCLILVEKGVRYSPGLLGDVEYITFDADDFSDVFIPVLRQTNAILHRQGLLLGLKPSAPVSVYVSDELIEPECNDLARSCLEKSKAFTKQKQDFEALEQAQKAVRLDPQCWRAWTTFGTTLVKVGRRTEGNDIFKSVLEMFPGNVKACATTYHNLAWVLFITSPIESLSEQMALYQKALDLDPSRVYSRAGLVCAYVLLDHIDKAEQLFTESVMYAGFPPAMLEELETQGPRRIGILAKLPVWAQNLLCPVEMDSVG